MSGGAWIAGTAAPRSFVEALLPHLARRADVFDRPFEAEGVPESLEGVDELTIRFVGGSAV